ncbi:MAG TPA: hypothetical protein VIA80_14865 [Hyphomonadaceae bacterium]
MDQLQQFLPYILNGVGGAVLAPIVAGLLGGKGLGAIGNIIAGVVGGVGVGAGAQAAGFGNILGGDTNNIMGYVQDLLEGGVGGGILGVIFGFMKPKPAA